MGKQIFISLNFFIFFPQQHIPPSPLSRVNFAEYTYTPGEFIRSSIIYSPMWQCPLPPWSA